PCSVDRGGATTASPSRARARPRRGATARRQERRSASRGSRGASVAWASSALGLQLSTRLRPPTLVRPPTPRTLNRSRDLRRARCAYLRLPLLGARRGLESRAVGTTETGDRCDRSGQILAG